MRTLLEFLDDDTTIITVNRRLARALINAHAERQLAAGVRAWRTPDVIPLSAWIERTWRECGCADVTALLRPAQERLVWEQVVREHAPPGGDDEAPLGSGPAARQAAKAYAIANAWKISLDAREFGFTQETAVFRTWARAFEARCAGAGRLDAGRAASVLGEGHKLAAAKLRRRAVFAGFDVKSPQQQAIRSALSTRGLDVVEAPLPQRNAVITRRAFDDPSSEMEAVVAWTRKALGGGPATRIGVVVPDLHRFRDRVERTFDEWLMPGSALPGRAVGYRPFNLSLGRPLGRVTVVGDALSALKLGRGRAELAAVGRLLRSPYLRGGHDSYCARAVVDGHLRDIGEPEISLRTLAVRLGAADGHDPGFEAIRALRERAPRRQLLDAWAAFFSDWLACLGWPGSRVLESEEFQAVEAFRGLLDELAGMGTVSGAVGYDRALSLLLELAEEHLFQPRRDPAPVQILGTLETAGLSFDKLWVTGLHDGSWPPRPEPHPFLPVSLQRRAGVPQASPEGQLELARTRLGGWLRCADEVVLSCARLERDEPLRPSPLIATVPLAGAVVDSESGPVSFGDHLQSEASVLERMDDDRGPALADTHISRGGATLIRDQAACPFRAFARWRLGARAVPIAASPLDARIRGNLVHAVLFDLWSEFNTQAALSALPVAALRERISSAVDRALAREHRARPDTLGGMIAQAERERLSKLVEAWLSVEKSRAPFRVALREKTVEGVVGPLTLRIRPDRVDQLESGEYFVVDYKTGRPRLKDWFGERPDDPQLAVYTRVVESSDEGGEVAGAAYAVVRRGGLGLSGLAAQEGLAEGVSTLKGSRIEAANALPDWESLKASWRKTLDALAASFASGDARVDPKSPHRTCSHCEVKPFCRIFEHRPNVTVEESKE